MVSARLLLVCSDIVDSDFTVGICACKTAFVLEECGVSIIDGNSQIKVVIGHVLAGPGNDILG